MRSASDDGRYSFICFNAASSSPNLLILSKPKGMHQYAQSFDRLDVIMRLSSRTTGADAVSSRKRTASCGSDVRCRSEFGSQQKGRAPRLRGVPQGNPKYCLFEHDAKTLHLFASVLLNRLDLFDRTAMIDVRGRNPLKSHYSTSPMNSLRNIAGAGLYILRRTFAVVKALWVQIAVIAIVYFAANTTQFSDIFDSTTLGAQLFFITLLAAVVALTALFITPFDPQTSDITKAFAAVVLFVATLLAPKYSTLLFTNRWILLLWAFLIIAGGVLVFYRHTSRLKQSKADAIVALLILLVLQVTVPAAVFSLFRIFAASNIFALCVAAAGFVGVLALTAFLPIGTWARTVQPPGPFKRNLGMTGLVLSGFAAIVCLSVLYRPEISVHLTPPVVLPLAAACWIIILSELVLLAVKTDFPVLTVLVAAAIIFSAYDLNYDHRVRQLQPGSQKFSTSASLREAFSEWLDKRPDRPKFQTKPYPVILVMGEGGGIRAAYWTAMCLAKIQDQFPEFRKHLFAISGVSGGSIGAMLFNRLCELEEEKNFPPSETYQSLTDKILGHDLLSAALGALLGPEIFQRILPFRDLRADRAIAIERAFERAFWQTTKQQLLCADFRSHFDTNASRPLLLLNSTGIDTGQRVVFSPVAVGDDQGVSYPMQETSSLALRMSTVAFLSARFPVISPTGYLHLSDGTVRPLVDGGYYDNTGAVTMSRVLTEIANTSRKDFQLLILSPRFVADDAATGNTFSKVKFGPVPHWELFSIVQAFLAVRSTHSISYSEFNEAVSDLKRSVTVEEKPLQLKKACRVLPLGWYLSLDSRNVIKSELPKVVTPDPLPSLTWPIAVTDLAGSLKQRLQHDLAMVSRPGRVALADPEALSGAPEPSNGQKPYTPTYDTLNLVEFFGDDASTDPNKPLSAARNEILLNIEQARAAVIKSELSFPITWSDIESTADGDLIIKSDALGQIIAYLSVVLGQEVLRDPPALDAARAKLALGRLQLVWKDAEDHYGTALAMLEALRKLNADNVDATNQAIHNELSQLGSIRIALTTRFQRAP
jgi:hypothetical protein